MKRLCEAKSRLASLLTEEQRATLVLHMLHHVIDMLCASESLEAVSVVSPDPRVLEQVATWGTRALVEEQQGHNQALHAAAAKELATGATALLTISADLPLLQIQDIQSIVEHARQYNVVLAPSHDNTGTNALLIRPPLALPYLFGPDSLRHFITAAQQRDLSSTCYRSIGTALDIDTDKDLELLWYYKREAE